jgi:uncharacterized membrane protein YebE (DUF533 family)
MSMQSLLDQLLRSGLGGLAGGATGTAPAAGGTGGGHLGKYATGAAAGGALALLLGSRRGRKMGGKVLKYGTAAALGAVAWRVYQDWQAKQAAAALPMAAPAATPAPTVPTTPMAFAQLPAPQVEAHSQAMLKAMIAAAKADGHMDERERDLVEAELHRLEADPALRAWVDAELRRPVEPAEVAAVATGPEMAAEVYLASLLVADDTTTMERAYLDALAAALKLPPGLKAELEARARQDA